MSESGLSSLEATVDLDSRAAYAAGFQDAAGNLEDLPMVLSWIFRVPMLGPLRQQYFEFVQTYNRDLLGCFESTSRIRDEERDEGRDAVTSAVRWINRQQAFRNFAWRISPVLTWVAVWPGPWVFCLGAWVIAWSEAPTVGQLAWAVVATVYLFIAFLAVFRDTKGEGEIPQDGIPKPTVGTVCAWSLVLGAVVLTVMGRSIGMVLPGLGAILLALLITMATVLTLGSIMEYIRQVRWRATTYLAEVAFLVMLSALSHPDWPEWLTQGVWTGLWASTAIGVVLGVLLVAAFLVTELSNWWKDRYAIDECVQTLLWLVMRIDDLDRPEDQRSEVSRMRILPSPYSLAWDLEYVAKLIERSVPRILDTGDRAGNKMIADRCRGIATSVRELKTETLLNQRRPLGELADALASAVVPIALGDWNTLAHVTTEDQPSVPSLGLRTLRWTGRIVGAIAPIAVVFALKSWLPDAEKLLDPLVPIGATWLVLSIITWIDPRANDRASSVGNILKTLPTFKSS
jgi:hypothetical protein